MKVGVLMLLLVLQAVYQARSQAIVLSPLEYIAYEGGPGHTFHCTLTVPSTSPSGALVIYVDGELIGTPEQIRRGISVSELEQLNSTTYYQNVNISSLQVNANTTLHCVGFGFTFTDGPGTSNSATFRVQGLLGPPSITPSHYNYSHIEITWSSPFSLDITDIEPDITHYRVCNTVSGVCTNTAGTSFFIDSTTCEYSVSACNLVGCGEKGIYMCPADAPVLIPTHYIAYEGGPGCTYQCIFIVLSSSPPGVLLIYVDGNEISTAEQIRRGVTGSLTEQLNSTTYSRNITISSLQINSNTVLQCHGFGYGLPSGFASSNIATFMVQGLLDPPSIPESPYNDSHIKITWSPPSSLNITDTEPDISHYRVCTTVSDVCTNTSDMSYCVDCTTGNLIEYTVSACNPVGCGEEATYVCSAVPAPSSTSTFPAASPTPKPPATPTDGSSGGKDSNEAVIIGSVLGAVIVVVAIGIVIISTAVCIIYMRKQSCKSASMAGPETKENMSYEMVATYNLQEQVRVGDMKPCPAYVHCTPRR